jgi:hypothetical protein
MFPTAHDVFKCANGNTVVSFGLERAMLVRVFLTPGHD